MPISKIISRYQKSIQNCKAIAPFVDRLYVYDNSIDNVNARPLFRLTSGNLVKQYSEDIPEWAKTLL